VTFNFPYTEKGRKVPDAPAALESCYRCVVERVAGLGARRALFIGGKSMGGRIATQIAAAGSLEVVNGIVLLGYPLHPPGKPQQLRTAHLPKIAQPMLVVQGSRDTFGTPQELSPVLQAIPATTELMVIDGGDHSFNVSKSSGVSQLDLYAKIWDTIITWTSRIAASSAR
jgi:predicted alpha/beta-hydrolase family hydrolase